MDDNTNVAGNSGERRGRRRGRTIADVAAEAKAARAAKAAKVAATEAAATSGTTVASRAAAGSSGQGSSKEETNKDVEEPEAAARSQHRMGGTEDDTTSNADARHNAGRERGRDPQASESYHSKRQRVQREVHDSISNKSGDGTGTEDGVT